MATNYRRARHIMLDIETLDTKPSAAVLSIAAVAFRFVRGDEGASVVEQGFIERIPSLRQQLVCLGRTVSVDTQSWWAKQDKTAQGEVVGPPGGPVGTAMSELAAFVSSLEPDYIWAQGASFDFPILQSLAGTQGVDLWPFWKERDCRTILGLPDSGPVDRKAIAAAHGLQAHKALDDCRIQAEAMKVALFD